MMEVDVDQQLRLPEAIFISTQRPDIFIYSLKLRKVVLIELTCPADENIEEKHSEKRTTLMLIGKFTCLP